MSTPQDSLPTTSLVTSSESTIEFLPANEIITCVDSVKDKLHAILPDGFLVEKLKTAPTVKMLANRIAAAIHWVYRIDKWQEADGRAEQFIQLLRAEFFDGHVSIEPKLWKALRETDVFLSAINTYIKTHIRKIFLQRNEKSVYTEIEFSLFLLGAPEWLDITIDIESSKNEKIEKFVEYVHKEIIYDIREVKKIEDEAKDNGEELLWNSKTSILVRPLHEKIEIRIEGFIQLMETLSKTISLYSIGAWRHYAMCLDTFCREQISLMIDHLKENHSHSGKILPLHYELGKFMAIHSHMGNFGGCSTDADYKARGQAMRADIMVGFPLMETAHFLGDARIAALAKMIAWGHASYIYLLEIDKRKEAGFLTNERAVALSGACLEVFRQIYHGETPNQLLCEAFFEEPQILPINDEKSDKKGTCSAEVIEDFIETNYDPDNIKLETIHHLALFDSGISWALLERLALFLSEWDAYGNIYHETCRIKTLSVILRKLSKGKNTSLSSAAGDAVSQYLDMTIRDKSPTADHPYAYLALAVFYITRDSREESENTTNDLTDKAHFAYAYFNQLDSGDQFTKEKNEFFKSTTKKEREFFRNGPFLERLKPQRTELTKIPTWIYTNKATQFKEGGNEDDIHTPSWKYIHSLVRKLFYNIPLVATKLCRKSKNDSPLCKNCHDHDLCGTTPRGYLESQIFYGENKSLVLRYPANTQEAFEKILRDESEFIEESLDAIEFAFRKNRESLAKEERNKIERQTNHLTGFPNQLAFEEYLQDLQDHGKTADFVFVQITNHHLFKNGAIKACAQYLNTIFANSYLWMRIFHLGDSEFMFVKDSSEAIDIEEFSEKLRCQFEAFRYAMPSTVINGNLIENSSARPIVRVAYVKDEVFSGKDKLEAMLRNSGDDIIGYVEQGEETDYTSPEIECALRTALEEAIKEDRITLYYQEIRSTRISDEYPTFPDFSLSKCDIETEGEIKKSPRKFECLLRLFGENGSMLPLWECLKLAEDYHLSKAITLRMLEKVCVELKDHSDWEFSINVCPNDLKDEQFIAQFIAITKKYGATERVIVELVETPLKHGDDEVIKNLSHFSKEHIKIAIDDYGQKASGLDRVKRMNPYYVKLDRVFAEELRFAMIRRDLKWFFTDFEAKFQELSGMMQWKVGANSALQDSIKAINTPIEWFYKRIQELSEMIKYKEGVTPDMHAAAENIKHLILSLQDAFKRMQIALNGKEENSEINLKIAMKDMEHAVAGFPNSFKRMQVSLKGKEEDSEVSLKIAIKDIELLIGSLHERWMEVIVEFVETKEIADALRELKADWLQWYYFSKPVPFDKIEKLAA